MSWRGQDPQSGTLLATQCKFPKSLKGQQKTLSDSAQSNVATDPRVFQQAPCLLKVTERGSALLLLSHIHCVHQQTVHETSTTENSDTCAHISQNFKHGTYTFTLTVRDDQASVSPRSLSLSLPVPRAAGSSISFLTAAREATFLTQPAIFAMCETNQHCTSSTIRRTEPNCHFGQFVSAPSDDRHLELRAFQFSE